MNKFAPAVICLLITATAMAGCGSSTSSTTNATLISSNNLDSEGRKIAGGCTPSAVTSCYEYTGKGGWYDGDAQYLVDNCTTGQSGTWDPNGCALANAVGYCQLKYGFDIFVRHYYYTAFPDTVANLQASCLGAGGAWTTL